MANTVYKVIMIGLLLPDLSKVNIGFKLDGFKIPGTGVFETEKLVEEEKAKLEKVVAIKAKAEKQVLLSEMVLPSFIGSYVESKSESAVFDIITDEVAADATILESKFSMAEKLKAAEDRIKELEEAGKKTVLPENEEGDE